MDRDSALGRRGIVAGLIAVIGLVGVESVAGAEDWLWPALAVLGLVAGSFAAQPRRLWLIVAAVVVGDAAGSGLGFEALRGPYWFLLAGGHVLVVGAAFVVGTALGWQRASLTRPWRRGVIGVVGVAVLGLGGYGGVAGVVFSADYVNQPGTEGCANPSSEFGWAYEAVNYDIADDAAVLAASSGTTPCHVPASSAGSAVVSSDGTPLAAWYIPAAAADSAPEGPTLVLVHGGKANKSGMLEYAPAFHEAYNLLLVDLRNSGRSGAAMNSGSVHERHDVRAMVDWLAATKHPTWIGLVGNSNGAAAGLAEAVDDSRIRALVLDSMQAAIITQLGNIAETEQHLPAWPAAWAVITGASLRVGGDLTAVDPVRMIRLLGDRPVVLLHGTADLVDRPRDSLQRNVIAALDAGVDVTFHVCAGAGHGLVRRTCPDAWASWATTFLDEARSR